MIVCDDDGPVQQQQEKKIRLLIELVM